MNDDLLARELVRRGLVAPAALEALRARPDPRPLAERLRGAVDPRALAWLVAELGTPRGTTPPMPGSDPAGELRASSRRLTTGQRVTLAPELELSVERLLGEGGMGVVYLVRDGRLGRQAALKLVKEGGHHSRALRFQRESLVTARLDHPGIPPVYAVGRTPAGEDYLLMRYVAGESLTSRVESQRDRRNPPRELLDALHKVSEALAYAHSRGVVHRDLKPDNVMLGAFGEVLLMDWGLARDLSESSDRDASLVARLTTERPAAQEGAHGLTREGAVLGTPGWLSPEQAQGKDVDQRSDVFGLGALLCFVLTGHPPVAGATMAEVLVRAATGQVEGPRARCPWVPLELDAIARRALAREPRDRYPDAQAFARDLKAWLDGRPVSAHRYGARERLVRSMRARPAVAAALMVTLVLSFVAGAAEALRARALRSEARLSARQAAEAAWAPLAVPGPADEARLATSLAALQAAQRWRDLDPGDDAAREAQRRAALALSEVAAAGRQWALARQAVRQSGQGEETIARALAELDAAERAGAERRRAEIERLLEAARSGELSRRPDGLADAVFRLAGYSEPETAALLAERLDALTARELALLREEYLGAGEPDAEERQRGAPRIDGLDEALALLERAAPGEPLPPEAQAALDAAERRLEQRMARNRVVPLAPARAVQILAARQSGALGPGGRDELRLLVQALGRLPAAEGSVEALSRNLCVEREPERLLQVGLSLCRLGTPRALTLARGLQRSSPQGSAIAVVLGRALAWSEPQALQGGDALGWIERAEQHHARGDRKAALEAVQRALDLDGKLGLAWAARGALRLAAGELAGAEEDLQRAIGLEPRLGAAWADLATVRLRRGELDPATEAAEKAVASAPEDPRAWAMKAWVSWFQAREADAAQAVERALELDPGQALAWAVRGLAHIKGGEVDLARADAARACDLAPDDPDVWLGVGLVEVARGDFPAAEAALARALQLAPEHAWAITQRGHARFSKGDLRGGLDDLERAAELTPRDPAAWTNLGQLRLRAGDLAGALRTAERALALDPAYETAWTLRAWAHLAADQLTEARAAADRAVEVGRESANAWNVRGRVRASQGDLPGATEDLARASVLAPGDTATKVLLAGLQSDQGDRAAAMVTMDEAIAADPRNATALGLRAALRIEAKDYQGAIADAQRAAELQPRDPRPLFTLGRARARLGEPEAGLRDLTEAIRLGPTDPLAWFQRAALLDELGRRELAATDYRKALELAPPGWKQVPLIKERLAERGR